MRRLMLVSIVLLLALFAPIHPMITQGQSPLDPIAVACGTATSPPDFLLEIRAAASEAAIYKSEEEALSFLQKLNRTIDPSKLAVLQAEVDQRIAELEPIAQGPNTQCRSSVFLGLDLYYLARSIIILERSQGDEGAARKQLQELAAAVYHSSTYELAVGRVSGLVLLVSVPFEGLAKDPTPWERILCGERVQFRTLGLTLDGSFFIRNNDSEGFPFRILAGALWVVAEGNLLRADPFLLQTLQDKAVHGCTPELREIAAGLVIQARFGRVGLFGIIEPPDPAKLPPREAQRIQEELTKIAASGASPELQGAAAGYLYGFLRVDTRLTDEDLQKMSVTAETAALRRAAGTALGLRWLQQVEQGKLALTTVLRFLSADGRGFTQGTFFQLTALHTQVHPELAGAAVLPLADLLFNVKLGELLFPTRDATAWVAMSAPFKAVSHVFRYGLIRGPR